MVPPQKESLKTTRQLLASFTALKFLARVIDLSIQALLIEYQLGKTEWGPAPAIKEIYIRNVNIDQV